VRPATGGTNRPRITTTTAGTLAALLTSVALAGPASADQADDGHGGHDGHGAAAGPNLVDEPASFSSSFSVGADADQVPPGGEPGATGTFDLRLDATSDTICFDIELRGVTPPYESPADTATHIHQGAVGEPGPPRVVFPDPELHDDGRLTSTGCIAGPFVTGIGPDAGGDHGDGFTVAQLEADPSAYYVDTHTTTYPDGAVRGQFGAALPVGGMDTGDGSTSTVADGATAGASADGDLLSDGAVAVVMATTVVAAGALTVGGVTRRRRAAATDTTVRS
jgi:hypothetical protein